MMLSRRRTGAELHRRRDGASSRSFPLMLMRSIHPLRVLAVALFGSAVFAATYFGSSSLSRLAAPPATRPSAMAPGADVRGGGVSATDRHIGVLQERLRQQP